MCTKIFSVLRGTIRECLNQNVSSLKTSWNLYWESDRAAAVTMILHRVATAVIGFDFSLKITVTQTERCGIMSCGCLPHADDQLIERSIEKFFKLSWFTIFCYISTGIVNGIANKCSNLTVKWHEACLIPQGSSRLPREWFAIVKRKIKHSDKLSCVKTIFYNVPLRVQWLWARRTRMKKVNFSPLLVNLFLSSRLRLNHLLSC